MFYLLVTLKGYRYHKLRKAFSKFYRRHFELIEYYHVSLKKTYFLLCNPEFYGDLVYKFKTRGPIVLLTLTLYLGLVKHKTYITWKIYGKEMALTFNTHIPS